MINMYPESNDYGVPFGVRICYDDRYQRCLFKEALCKPLSKEQRQYVQRWQQMWRSGTSMLASEP